MMRMDDDSSVSSDDDFTSPFASLRATFPIPKCESETLVANKDSSFIGARMSPVAFDDEGNNEDFASIAPYRKALDESIESSFSNERTSLLGRRAVTRSRPLWDEESVARAVVNDGKGSRSSKELPSKYSWGMILCAISGIHLTCMGMHDLYVWYLSYRLGYQRQDVAWRLPLLSPSTSTLIRFGALVPWKVLHGQPWRMLSSIFMSTSLVEYLLMCSAWYALWVGESRLTLSWVLYLLATITGQLWTMAWDSFSVSGCTLRGTCGVLCAAGAAKPRQRFLLLIISISLFLTSLTDTATNAFVGVLGSSMFGVAYYGMGCNSASPPEKSVRILSWVVAVSLWLIPLLWLAINT